MPASRATTRSPTRPADGKGSFDAATVTITVANVNQVPDAKDDAFSTLRNTAVSGNVLTDTSEWADTDPDGDKLFASLASAPANGNVVLNSDGSFSYTPNSGFVGTDTFTYKASDGIGHRHRQGEDHGHRAGRTWTLPMTSSPRQEDKLITGNLLANDIDPEGDKFSLISTTAPSSGSLITDFGGQLHLYAVPELLRHRLVQLHDSGRQGLHRHGQGDLDLHAGQRHRRGERHLLDQGRAEVDVAAPGVLANDFDPDTNARAQVRDHRASLRRPGRPRRAAPSTSRPTVRSTIPRPPTSKAPIRSPTRSPTARATDTATVTINVGNVNDAPDAKDDPNPGDPAIVIPEDSSNNFIPCWPTTATSTAIRSSSRRSRMAPSGTVQIVPGDAKAGGGVRYTPNPNFFGTDTFTYTISDGKGGSDTATVNVVVSDQPDTPSPVDDKFNARRRRYGHADRSRRSSATTSTRTPRRCRSSQSAMPRPTVGGTVVLNGDGIGDVHSERQLRGRRQVQVLHQRRQADDPGLVTITYAPVNDPPTVDTDNVRHGHQHADHGHHGASAGQRQRSGKRHLVGGRREQRRRAARWCSTRRTARSRSARPTTSSAQAASTTPSPMVRAPSAPAW